MKKVIVVVLAGSLVASAASLSPVAMAGPSDEAKAGGRGAVTAYGPDKTVVKFEVCSLTSATRDNAVWSCGAATKKVDSYMREAWCKTQPGKDWYLQVGGGVLPQFTRSTCPAAPPAPCDWDSAIPEVSSDSTASRCSLLVSRGTRRCPDHKKGETRAVYGYREPGSIEPLNEFKTRVTFGMSCEEARLGKAAAAAAAEFKKKCGEEKDRIASTPIPGVAGFKYAVHNAGEKRPDVCASGETVIKIGGKDCGLRYCTKKAVALH